MSRTAKKALITVVVTILVTILFYLLIGFVVNLRYMAIYDQMPTGFQYEPSSPDYPLFVQIDNDAPLTLPLVNPAYTVSVSVTGDNNTYAYFTSFGGQPYNFSKYSINMGIIVSGSGKSPTIMIRVGGGNFSITVDVYLNLVFTWKATSATYLFEKGANNFYNITREG
jgi:hypothetical protein